jgi:hypothetical protein
MKNTRAMTMKNKVGLELTVEPFYLVERLDIFSWEERWGAPEDSGPRIGVT